MDVSIVIPVWNRLDLTRQCLEAIRRTVTIPHEVIVVDNCSTDGSADFLAAEEEAGRLRAILNPENRGFGKACNQGLAAARGRHVLFLNNDTIPLDGWLDALVRVADDDPEVGMVGARLLYPDGTIQHAGVSWNDRLELEHPNRGVAHDAPEVLEQRDIPAVTGACILLPRDLATELGGFDESFHMYVEDVDLCMRVWERGRRVVYCPDSVLFHLENASVLDVVWRNAHVVEGWRRLNERWGGRWPVPVRRLVWPLELPGGPRHVAVAASADELAADPGLLAAYGRAFTSDDPLSLVVYFPAGDATAEERLVAAVAAAGLDGDGAPDLVALPLDDLNGTRVLACYVRGVYTRSQPAGAFAAVPHFDDRRLDALHALALGSPAAAAA